MREQRIGAEQAVAVREGDAALCVAVLREDHAALAAQIAHLFGLVDGGGDLAGGQLAKMFGPQGRRDDGDADAPVARPVPRVDQTFAGGKLVFETDLAFGFDVAVPARIGARMRRARRAHGHDRARAHPEHALAVRGPIGRLVGAHDRVAAAEQRNAGRDPEAQALEGGKLRFGEPERVGGTDRVGLAAGVVPKLRIAPTHRFDEAVARMRMRVDEARQHGLALCVDRAFGRVASLEHVAGADIDDAVARDRDRPVVVDGARRVERGDNAVCDKQIDHKAAPVGSRRLPMRATLGTSDSRRLV